ncbi:MAG: hypothetical protein EXQ99_05665 [Alphaproteobacteria bacterium]|nr:hypothetical protein [Alphaproteobacteria bacterium]
MSARRIFWLIFGVALVLRIAYALAMYLIAGPAGLMSSDSAMYLGIVDNFVTADGWPLDTEHMPLYVLWLVLHRVISGTLDPLFPALTQGVVDAFACVFIARLAGLFDRRLILLAGLVAACNPTQIVLSAQILNDSVFFFFSCLMLHAALDWLHAPRWRAALVLGGALGLGLSTRVMMLPWLGGLVVLLPILAFILRRFSLSTLAHMAAVVLLCLVVQAPIWARNISRYDSIDLTSQSGVHSLLWIAPMVREATDGTPHEQGAHEYQARFEAQYPGPEDNPFERSHHMSKVAHEILAELRVGAIAKAWLIGGMINLFSPAPILAPPVRDLPRTGFYGTPGKGKLTKIRNFLFANDNPVYAWVLVLSGLGAIGFRAIELCGLGLVARARDAASVRYWRASLVLLLIWVGYILVVNGPIASAKYRLPIEPLAALGLAIVMRAVIDWRLRRRAARAAHSPSESR